MPQQSLVAAKVNLQAPQTIKMRVGYGFFPLLFYLPIEKDDLVTNSRIYFQSFSIPDKV